jgi:hypothetical protein
MMDAKNPSLILFTILVAIVLSGCGSTSENQFTPVPTAGIIIETPFKSTDQKPQVLSVTPTQNQATSYQGLTYQMPDGNRVVSGRGNLPQQTPVEFALPGIPVWVVGAPYQDGIIWEIALQDGEIVTLFTSNQSASEYSNHISALMPGTPPYLKSSGNLYSLVNVPDANRSALTHPTYIPRIKARAYITQNGEVKIIDQSDRDLATLQVNALPDARILIDERDRLLLLSDSTDKYNHGVLGDNLEAKSITLIETQPTIQISSRIYLGDNEVIEGITPIWVDINGDEQREIIVTISDLDLGAGIVIFSETGERLAEGPKMGRAYRWRHQIGYLTVGPEGENELVVVRTPHIGGVVEYYRYSDGDLTIAAEYTGITSHTIGSRDLDMAALGDFDGDGVNELLLPNPDFTELVAIRRTPAGAEQAWRIAIGGVMSTNLSGVTLPNGRIALAVGRDDGVLTLWLP